jgi:hypothetical protein
MFGRTYRRDGRYVNERRWSEEEIVSMNRILRSGFSLHSRADLLRWERENRSEEFGLKD